jgi:glyoxylase I family protein
MPKPPQIKGHELPSRLHHFNYTTLDHAKTREFYEDVLGFPLVAFWTEIEPIATNEGKPTVLGHAFYGLADGSFLGFMHFGDPAFGQKVKAPKQPVGIHLALAVSRELQAKTVEKLRGLNIPVMQIDHGFVNSIYFQDPNGLTIEFSCDPDNVEEVYGEQRGTAHDSMRRYLAGDHRKTNKWLPEIHGVPTYE